MSGNDMETAVEFVRNMALPEFDDMASAEDDADVAVPDFEKPELAITVGSQIASFAEGVDPALREKIANAFLFAQQAADKQIENNPAAKSSDWYQTYTDVLSRVGWTVEDRTAIVRQIDGSAATVHKVIIPIITAALAPAAAATSIIVQVLQGLQEIDAGRPWITLFNRTSRRAKANQFQVAHIDRESAVTRIKLVAFELDAQHAVSQILFFKFATGNAELLHFESVLSVNEPVFNNVAQIIQDRLEDRARSFIMAIEI